MQSVFVAFGSDETIPDIPEIVDSCMDQNGATTRTVLQIFSALLLLCYDC